MANIIRLNFNFWEHFITAIFCFVIIIDPPDILLHAKLPTYILLFLFLFIRYKKFNGNAIIVLTVIYSILLFTNIIGLMRGNTMDIPFTIGTYKTFIMCFLLLFAHHTRFYENMLFPCICVGLIVVSIYILCIFFPWLQRIIYNWSVSHDYFLMMSRRRFLGIDIFSVFYRSLPLLVFPLALYSFKLFDEGRRQVRTVLSFLIVFFALLFGGTRACMLSGIFVAGFALFYSLRRTALGKIVSSLILFLFFVGGLVLVFLLLSESGEESNSVKFGHLASYSNLIENDPFVLLWGQGAGAQFFSIGFGRMTSQTEWSYFELFRWFGVVGGLIFIVIYSYPLVVLFSSKIIRKYDKPIKLAYLFYLVIAGTNPLMLGSSGILALLIMYSYIWNPQYITHTKVNPILN